MFGGIKKIHIASEFFDDFYLPMALAILDKENERRQKEGSLGPMEIVFYTMNPINVLLSNYIHKNLKFSAHSDLQSSHRIKDNVYILVIDENISHCRLVDIEADFYYRQTSILSNDGCNKTRNWKMFETPDEIYYQLNEDICKRK